MTRRKNMTKGERFETMEKRVQQLEMAGRITQMLIQQIGNSVSPMAQDLGELALRQRDSLYRTMALQELLGVDLSNLQAKALELQIKDFNESSDKEDAEKGYTPGDVVTEDTVVILTSKTPEEAEDKGYMRSKLLVRDIGFPQLKADLLGKTVGANVDAEINGVKHVITVLGVRNVPAVVAPVEETTDTNVQ